MRRATAPEDKKAPDQRDLDATRASLQEEKGNRKKYVVGAPLSEIISPSHGRGGSSNVEVYYTFNPVLFDVTRRHWKAAERARKDRTHFEGLLWDAPLESSAGKTRRVSRKFLTLSDLTPEQRNRLNRIDIVGRYGAALSVVYDKAVRVGSVADLGQEIERALGLRDLSQKLLEAGPEDRAAHKTITSELEKGRSPIPLLERGLGYGSFLQEFEDATNLGSVALASAPMQQLQHLKNMAAQAAAQQRSVEGRRSQRLRGEGERHDMPPLEFSDPPPYRSPNPLGLAARTPSHIPPQSPVAALEHLEDDARALLDAIQDRKDFLSRELKR